MWVKVSREGTLALLDLHPVLCVLTVDWPSYDQPSLRVGSLTERRSHAWSSVRRSDLGWRKPVSFSWSCWFFFSPSSICCPTHAHAEQCPCEKWMLDGKQKQHPLQLTSTAKKQQKTPAAVSPQKISLLMNLSKNGEFIFILSFCIPAFDSFRTSNSCKTQWEICVGVGVQMPLSSLNLA